MDRPGVWKRASVSEVLVWTNTGVNSNVLPDTDIELDVQFAKTVHVQVDTTHTSNTTTSVTIDVQSSIDGIVWDTLPLVTQSFVDGGIRSLAIEPSSLLLRFRLTNSDPLTTAYVTARIFVRKE